MIPPIQSHTTSKVDRPRPVVECTAAEDKARQEFKKEADVNFLLRKYGAGVPLRQVSFGVQEFGVDRLEALSRVSEAQEAFYALPEAIRSQYPSWVELYAAIADGSFKAPEVAEVSSAAEGAEPKAP